MSEFTWALKNGDLDQVRDFVENKGESVNKEIDGRYPIHYAADYGQKEVLEYLISKGSSVDIKDKHGITAILAAIWEGHTNCVKLLLEKGADKKGQTPDGATYLQASEKPEITAMLQ